MKKLTGLVIILAALVLGGYYGMGVLTEKTLRKNIEAVNRTNGLNAEITQYNRGLYTSNAMVNWKLHVPAHVTKDASGQAQTVPAQDYNLDMPLTIHHGPVIFANNKVLFGLGYAESVFSFPHQYDEQFDSLFTKESMKPQLNLSVFINYADQSTLDFNIPGFKLFAKAGNGKFNWLGMNATSTITSEMKKIGGSITVDGADFSKDDIKMDLGKVTSSYDLHETPSGLYLGDANFNLPSISVSNKDQKVFELTDLELKSDSDIEQHLFNSHFKVILKSLLTNGQNYGPGDLEVALRNLDADVLAKFNQQLASLQNATDAQRQQALIALLPELPKLFSKGAEFEISKLNFKLPEGLIDGSLMVSLPKEENPNPLELLKKVQGNAKLKVPAVTVKKIMQTSLMQQMAKQPELQQALAQQLQANQGTAAQDAQQQAQSAEQVATMKVEKLLSQWQESGLITAQGSDFLIEVNLADGKFSINGKPFDASMMKF